MAKNKNKYQEPISRILVIRFSSIGDIVLTTAVVRCLRRKYGAAAQIDFLVKEKFKTVIEDNPHISNIITYSGDLDKTIHELSGKQYQFIADLQKNHRSKTVIRSLGVPSGTFHKLNFKKWLFTAFKINLLPRISIVERYFEAVAPLGVHNDGQGLDYFIPEKDVTELEDVPLGHWSGFVGAVIGGAHATKKMPVEQWISFVEKCNYPVVLMGGPEDKENGDRIAATNPGKVYNSCGKFNINESADLVKRAKVIVTHDTGLMHIAAAFQKAIVSIWGNTVPELGMFPYYGFNDLENRIAPMSTIIEHKVYCRPCSKLGYNKCPLGHFKCMTRIKAQEISDAVDKLWHSVIQQEKSEGKFI